MHLFQCAYSNAGCPSATYSILPAIVPSNSMKIDDTTKNYRETIKIYCKIESLELYYKKRGNNNEE